MDEKTKERLILEAQSSASSLDLGFKVEVQHLGFAFVITSKEFGSVSLSYEDRCWAPGITASPRLASLKFVDRGGRWQDQPLWGFRGRGWWKKMVEASLRALHRDVA
jgi:hypothetical protein